MDQKLKTQNSNLKTEHASAKSNDLKTRTTEFSLDLIRTVTKIKRTTENLVLIKQLIRSGTSIGANIVEAKSSSSLKEFINYYQIALKSGNETKYWLYLLKENTEHKLELDGLLNETTELCKIIAASVVTLKKKTL